MSKISALDYLKNHRVGAAYIPVQDQDEPMRLDCVAIMNSDGLLEAQFLPGQLPLSRIPLRKKWVLSFETGQNTFSLFAFVEEKKSDYKIALRVQEEIDYSQNREYFRVMTDTPVEVAVVGKKTDEPQPLQVGGGETIDISGSGILVCFFEPFLLEENTVIKLAINIPIPETRQIQCTGRVIRTDTSLACPFKVAIHYEHIEEEDRDAVIAFCLAEQRKQLRLKVRVLGPSTY